MGLHPKAIKDPEQWIPFLNWYPVVVDDSGKEVWNGFNNSYGQTDATGCGLHLWALYKAWSKASELRRS